MPVYWQNQHAILLHIALWLPPYHCVADTLELQPNALEPLTQYLFSQDSKLQDAREAQCLQEIIAQPFAMQLPLGYPVLPVNIIPRDAYTLCTRRLACLGLRIIRLSYSTR